VNLLYHLATLPPKIPEAEAISQEITTLCHRFKAGVIYINPNQITRLYVPRLLFGFHKLRELWQGEGRLDLHHFYNPDPFPFPYLRQLRKPVIYSITCGVGDRRPNLAFFSALKAIAVSDERSLKKLKKWGLTNVFLVRAGIDTGRFTCSPLPSPQPEIRLMIASAPWTESQFRSKGIDALLEAAQLNPRLRLLFLWRGVLTEKMLQRVRSRRLEGQVEVIDRKVEVNQVLAGVHGTIVLAEKVGIIKAQPHSLLDSLAAGKPVLVSRAIPMSDYVEEVGCGQVVEAVSPLAILEAVEALVKDYEKYQQVAQRVGQRDFSQQMMLDSFQQLYDQVIA
jgi:glycosyltransferase involved in cell wall biosynthesis